MQQGVAVLGLIFAVVFIFVGVSQVDALESVAASVTSGSVQQFIRGWSFYTLMLGVFTLLMALGGIVLWALRR